ncbi:myelin-associated glycoprotein-like [Carcharodon carcharias]|uniref:myelin-associated glycoprotein-like n=1 Tax=Carcharodon carcharias TaxID=13397 RepID=UPI001B7DD7E6|nr:myelin-associated glycoprotein-like [Carcharodon carcharias]
MRTPQRLSVLVGSCVVIPCTVRHAFPGVKWLLLKGGVAPDDPGVTTIHNTAGVGSVDPDYRIRSGKMSDSDPSDCSFWISAIKNEDQGEYYIRGGDGTEMMLSDPVFLSVFGMPNVSVSREFMAGQAATVTCSVVHSCPEAKIDLKWIKGIDFSPAPSATELKDIDNGFDQRDWKGSMEVSSALAFTALRRHDRQVLGCEILLNGYSHGIQKMVTLDVQYPPTEPEIHLTPVAVLGRSAFIYCSTKSNPESRLELVKDGTMLSKESSNNLLRVEFSNIALEDEGQYSCHAANKHGTSVSSINVTVEHPPLKLLINSSMTVREGSSLRIYCITQSKPESHLQWVKDGTPIVNSYSGNMLTKNFTDIRYDDEGEYKCEARNKHGGASSQMNITVEYAPQKLLVNSSVVALEGQSLFLYCTAQGNPPVTLSWVRNCEVMNISHSGELKVAVNNISLEEDGLFWCVVANILGTANSSTQVIVEYPPRAVDPTNCTRSENSIICVCTMKSNPPVEHIMWSLDDSNVTAASSDVGVVSLEMDHHQMQSTLRLKEELGPEHNLSCFGVNKHGVASSRLYIDLPGRVDWKYIAGIGSALLILIALIAFSVAKKFRKGKLTKYSWRYSRANKRGRCENDPGSDGGEVRSNLTEYGNEIHYATLYHPRNTSTYGYVHCEEKSEYANLKFRSNEPEFAETVFFEA